MAETLADTAESFGAPPSNGSFFHRRIEFLPAKRPFTGFSNGSGNFRLETLNPTSSDPNRAGGSGQGGGRLVMAGNKIDGPEAIELGMDPELSFSITLKRIGAGLENLGNTCFLNSVLQCLTYTEPLAAYLQSGKHRTSCRKAGFCALCAIQNHVSRALQSTGRSLAPKDLVSNLRCISRNFRNARQEDAHEYMVNLLESMHKCCLPLGLPSESPSAFERSLVHKIFGGKLRSQVKCMQCSFCSDKFDPFLDLSLEINKADSVQKALAHFTTKEYLDGGAREYQCQRCKQKVKALKQLSIHKAPNVLTIHLKRFGSHQLGQKIDKQVQFGPTLDLKPFVTGTYEGDLNYTLYGVLVHYGGSTHSGHYYCYVRTSSGMWYSLDDHRVCNVSEKRVLEAKAYMLFYVRDRKNFTQRKPIDIVHAKSMIINATGTKMQYCSDQGPKITVQNGPTDKRVESLDPAAALTRVDVAVADALKETLKEKSAIGKVVESSVFQTNANLSTSPTLAVLMDEVEGLSNAGKCSTEATVASGSGEALKKGVFVRTGYEINKCYSERTANVKGSDLNVGVTNSICGQNSVDKKEQSNKVACTTRNNEKAEKEISDSFVMIPECNGFHSSAGDSDIKNIPVKDCVDKVSEKIIPLNRIVEMRHGGAQNGGLSKDSNGGNIAKIMNIIEPSEFRGLKSTSIPLQKNDPGHTSHGKLKKRFSKRQITGTCLSSRILFRAALHKKKHKKKKWSAVKIDSPTQEHLGPSSSEISRALSIGSLRNTEGKGSKLSSCRGYNTIKKNGKDLSYNLAETVFDEKKGDRMGQNNTVLATDKPPRWISSSPLARNGSVVNEANTLKENRRASMQNGIMNMLTRGLEEKIVAHWDSMEDPSSQITETIIAEPVNIGYIGDEWDEEYDKGKRKKVRMTNRDFGGPNPFQEIATQKAKSKKARIDRSSSGTQQFRI